ncbi:uncharacterized protein LOC133111127 [Conger conger]|uniref:uncharacterized protein LOC133111127 n=1 Tax=Conger conger TaxID=82655 RepID=UPI002A5A5CB4|nr:uncharacterized protein LOC133111127 [Conger conger]
MSKSHKAMGDGEWLARLQRFASSGVWPSGEGNRPAPRQKRWHKLYQKIEECPLQSKGQASLWGKYHPCTCGFHKGHPPAKVDAAASTSAVGATSSTIAVSASTSAEDVTHSTSTTGDILTRLEDIKAALTSTYGSTLKMDSTKKITKKLSGPAKGTAQWLTSVGNEIGQVLISVLTADEGGGIDAMTAGLVERYRRAGVAPPTLLYVDSHCCKEAGDTKLKQRFSGWPNLIIRLDIWHFIRRLAGGVTTDAHQLYPIFMARLSACIFEWDAGDLAQLRRAKREQLTQEGWPVLMDAEVDKHISKAELALHCKRRTRGTDNTISLVDMLTEELIGDKGKDSMGVPLFDTVRMMHLWRVQKRHVGCIQDPPNVELYTETGTVTKGGIALKTYRCARGSTSLESFHCHLARFIPGNSANSLNFQIYLLEGIFRWNKDRAAAALAGGGNSPLRTYTGELVYAVNTNYTALFGRKLVPQFSPPAVHTGELIGVQYLLRQSKQPLEDMTPGSDRTSELLEDLDIEEQGEEDEGFVDTLGEEAIVESLVPPVAPDAAQPPSAPPLVSTQLPSAQGPPAPVMLPAAQLPSAQGPPVPVMLPSAQLPSAQGPPAPVLPAALCPGSTCSSDAALCPAALCPGSTCSSDAARCPAALCPGSTCSSDAALCPGSTCSCAACCPAALCPGSTCSSDAALCPLPSAQGPPVPVMLPSARCPAALCPGSTCSSDAALCPGSTCSSNAACCPAALCPGSTCSSDAALCPGSTCSSAACCLLPSCSLPRVHLAMCPQQRDSKKAGYLIPATSTSTSDPQPSPALRPIIQPSSSFFLPPATDTTTMLQHDQKWVAEAVFRGNSKGKLELKDSLQLWYHPPPPTVLYHQAPTPDRFFSHRLLVWMPYRLWKLRLQCTSPACAGHQLCGGGLHRRVRQVLDIDNHYNMVRDPYLHQV